MYAELNQTWSGLWKIKNIEWASPLTNETKNISICDISRVATGPYNEGEKPKYHFLKYYGVIYNPTVSKIIFNGIESEIIEKNNIRIWHSPKIYKAWVKPNVKIINNKGKVIEIYN